MTSCPEKMVLRIWGFWKAELDFDRWKTELSFLPLWRRLSFSGLDRQRWIEIFKHPKMRRTLGWGQFSMVSIDFEELCLSPRVTMDRSKKLINLFVSETKESACICICICVCICICIVLLLLTHEPITRIISKQLDIKLGPFTQEELDSVLRKIKNRKAAGLDEIPPEVWKTRQFDDILLRHCNAVYNQNPIDRWMKGCILPFPKKGDLGLAKNYRGITLTSIAAKIYNALLRNRIEPKIDNILRKNQNGFEEIDPRPHKY